MVAAATENYDNSKDDDPGAVIVKEMAKAVVVHIQNLPVGKIGVVPLSLLSYA